MFDKLLVFDIETVPDSEALTWINTGRNEVSTGSGTADDFFPKPPFHRVISIGMLVADIVKDGNYDCYQITKVGSLSAAQWTEKQMLEKFFDFWGKKLPKLVSYNGKGFDIPVLKYRAMRSGICAEKVFQTGDRWNSYAQRYSCNWHCDLLDVLTDFGASQRCSMHEVCCILQIPSKIGGVNGASVANMFAEGKQQSIDNYCELDVLSTYLLYLRYALLLGYITGDGFKSMETNLRQYLLSKQQNHWNEFVDEWQRLSLSH
jgi:predicted PolB exonuclease-like 3'-5' exonuclease